MTSPDESSERLLLDLPRFCFSPPTFGMHLRSGAWGAKIDEMSASELETHLREDVRPQWCGDLFPGMNNFDVIELGPMDGAITAGLERYGVKSITAIEANADSFLRCLILKNALGLRATYLLGDFVQYLRDRPKADMIYASGVLYHMTHPLELLELCAAAAPNIYVWSFYYDEQAIEANAYERRCFDGTTEVVSLGREEFTYHKRFYTPEIRDLKTYAGGIHSFANWMTLEDLRRAFETVGFKILREVPDAFQGIPAMNFVASKR